MKRVLAIAALTVRAAIRSRVLAALTALLLTAVIGLPLTIRGDGTAAGRVQILLAYTMGAAALVLSISSVWSGCAAISQEIRDRQMHLLAVKPVRPLDIWLGKWLGLTAMNAVLLAFSAAVVYGLLEWTARPAAIGAEERAALDEEILAARASARPDETEFETATREQFQKELAAGRVADGTHPQEAYRAFRHLRRVQFYAVPPGALREWRIRLPVAPTPDRPIFLRFRFAKSELTPAAVAGQWFFGTGDQARLTTAGEWPPDAFHSLALPAQPLVGEREIIIAFGNADPSGATVFFDPDRGLEVLMRAGGFAGNFARAGLLLLVQLAFLTAVGLAAGTLFSMPVASFVSISLVVLMKLSGYIGEMAGQRHYFAEAGRTGPGVALADHLLRLVFRGLRAALAPLDLPNVLDLLASGRLVAWGSVAGAVAIHLALYGGLLAIAGAAVLRRRELGLPS